MLDPTTCPALATQPHLVSDMHLDVTTSPETVFLMVELSDAMQRGVRHYKIDGTPLNGLNDVIQTLIFEGEVCYDDASSAEPRGH